MTQSAISFPGPIRSPGQALLAGLVGVVVIAVPCAAAENDHRGTLTGSFAQEQFIAGEEVRVEAATVGDLFAAGGEIVFDGLAAEDVIAAGGSLRLRDMVVEDLTAAGGEIDISGEVRDDLIAAGGRLHQGPDSVVGGYALLAGGSLDLEGRIKGNLKAAGGRIRLSGEVTGDVDLSAGRITLAPGARIGGKLTYRSGSEADIAPGAVVAGGVERVKGEVFEVPVLTVIGFAVGGWIVVVLGLTLVGAVLQAAVPALLTEATDTLEARPWASFGLGFALAVATPVAASLLFVTLFGGPLALFLLALFAAALAFALIAVANWLGLRIARLFAGSRENETVSRRILWTFLGVFVLGLIALVPFVGFLVVCIAVSLGLGACALQFWRVVQAWRPGGSATVAP
ncbi:MAG: polymer-forming cytoskeletal protein [Rhodospirillales bacterium]|nr:polymer-forming cytoskeletal protein [Rhodospirillales bacterium]MDH3912427.1 polymer-forming cytoskeletal protein [Rhodospirillales bacterium]MDH3917371.1 polymer-forming cytoskeletal protein [Rhodospirillales bacterium]MDH3969654.1 polymer-forming cytoskeletal protein [Rhodospirillales bacterium]